MKGGLSKGSSLDGGRSRGRSSDVGRSSGSIRVDSVISLAQLCRKTNHFQKNVGRGKKNRKREKKKKEKSKPKEREREIISE
jgi:hypothetical protein